MSQNSDGSLKFQVFGMLEEYFKMSNHIYGDVTESLSNYKAQKLLISQRQKKKGEFN
jgi:hypothetical protein